MERVRDFMIAALSRSPRGDDTPFCGALTRDMPLPDSLIDKEEQYRRAAG
jgi:hypothetical protein